MFPTLLVPPALLALPTFAAGATSAIDLTAVATLSAVGIVALLVGVLRHRAPARDLPAGRPARDGAPHLPTLRPAA